MKKQTVHGELKMISIKTLTMQTIEVKSYLEIKKYCNEIQNKEYTFFRGTKVPYLLPSIVPKGSKLDIIHLLKIEMKLLKAFRNIYPHDFECDEITKDWLYRIRAREHELASRLMDWSNTFYKALDFATKHLTSFYEYGYLWILPMSENEIIQYNDFRKYPIEGITSSYILGGVKYGKDDELATHRQFVQGGNFLVQPPRLMTTELNKQPEFVDRLICLKVPSIYFGEIRQDIIKFEREDVNQDIMIDNENCIDLLCKSMNEKLLYRVNKKVNEFL